MSDWSPSHYLTFAHERTCPTRPCSGYWITSRFWSDWSGATGLERLGRTLPEGGVLAVQMPDNLMEPSHRLMQVAAGQLTDAVPAREALPPPSGCFARLKPVFRRLDIWHVIYNHPLGGVDGIVAWLMSTGLRPFLDPLDDNGRRGFLSRYRELLALSYPVHPDGTVLLRFPRLFLVGVR